MPSRNKTRQVRHSLLARCPTHLISSRRPTLTVVDGLAVGLLFSFVSRNGHRQRSIISVLVRLRYYSPQFIIGQPFGRRWTFSESFDLSSFIAAPVMLVNQSGNLPSRGYSSSSRELMRLKSSFRSIRSERSTH